MDSDYFDFYIDKNYKGIIIESLGRGGNIPPTMVPGVKKNLYLKAYQ